MKGDEGSGRGMRGGKWKGLKEGEGSSAHVQ